MGIFSRFKDIVTSNINAMLDKAEDPEKLIRLMIREMEETLVELKATCAGSMADRKRVGRELDQVAEQVQTWADRAELAVEKGREDLAREALQEKRRWSERLANLEEEATHFDSLIGQCKSDIETLEGKLKAAQEKQRLLIQRHIRANNKKRAQSDIRYADSESAVRRFEDFEQRIERLEAEADLVNVPVHNKPNLEEEFSSLEGDEDIEQELAELKKKTGKAPAKAEKSSK